MLQILYGATGSVVPGELLALMGPSGKPGRDRRSRGLPACWQHWGLSPQAPPPAVPPPLFTLLLLLLLPPTERPARPAGSGKTTLLSILGGRNPKLARVEGAVTFNKAQLSKRIKRQIGFVMQVGGASGDSWVGARRSLRWRGGAGMQRPTPLLH